MFDFVVAGKINDVKVSFPFSTGEEFEVWFQENIEGHEGVKLQVFSGADWFNRMMHEVDHRHWSDIFKSVTEAINMGMILYFWAAAEEFGIENVGARIYDMHVLFCNGDHRSEFDWVLEGMTNEAKKYFDFGKFIDDQLEDYDYVQYPGGFGISPNTDLLVLRTQITIYAPISVG